MIPLRKESQLQTDAAKQAEAKPKIENRDIQNEKRNPLAEYKPQAWRESFNRKIP